MILKLTERKWCELGIILYLFGLEDVLGRLACLHDHNAHKDGFKYGCVMDGLFKRLELPQAELLSLARTSGVPWVQNLSDSLNEIIAHGEYYPVQDMIRECEEEALMERAPYQEPRSEEEFQKFLKQMQESKMNMPSARDFCPPGWFVDISQV